jgi:MerR family transcriptional regulator, light-induced transcriptional regulator
MRDAQYPIQLVSRLTGLSSHLIRIWEQRYQAVAPHRTPGNRRLYSHSDIERLNLLRDITLAGHRIGQVARLPTHKLQKLALETGATQAPAAGRPREVPTTASFLSDCLAAITSLDAHALDRALNRGADALGAVGLLQTVVAPLMQKLGELWREGTLTAAHEHFATAVIRVFLGNAAKPFGPMENAPVLVVATPAGQVHELGALLVGATAANLGWRVTYLGASLPAAEIVGAVRQCGAKAVALSVVYPEDDARLEHELTRLRESLPAEVALLVGGRAMPAYHHALENMAAIPIENLVHLGSVLDALRRPETRARR